MTAFPRLYTEVDGAWRRAGPTRRVVDAFEIRIDGLRRLPGGIGNTWTDGRLVLKPVGCPPEHAWVCDVYAAWAAPDVRVPEPVRPAGTDDERPAAESRAEGRSADGWSVDGWGAHVFVSGRDADLMREINRVREASDAFHDAVKDLPRPEFMDARDDPWAFGDRLAWEGAEPIGDDETLELIDRLRGHLAPVSGAAQAIHGDILPNVLVADPLPPAVIDWPPYFRPAALGNAVAVTDAVTFRAAPLSLLDDWVSGDDWNQLLVRALLYRLGPTGVFASRNRLMGSLVTHAARVRPVIDAVLSR